MRKQKLKEYIVILRSFTIQTTLISAFTLSADQFPATKKHLGSMARVFTTEFFFRNHIFKAIVVIRDESKGLIIRIHVFDEESIRILGKDCIEFVGLKGYKTIVSLKAPEAQELLDVVYLTILNHLNTNQNS